MNAQQGQYLQEQYKILIQTTESDRMISPVSGGKKKGNIYSIQNSILQQEGTIFAIFFFLLLSLYFKNYIV